MIKVHIDMPWNTDRISIWIYENRGADEIAIYYPVSDTWMTIPKGSILPESPSLFLAHGEMLKALVDAAMPKFPPSSEMDRHLKDTMETRDRLLTIVETMNGVPSSSPGSMAPKPYACP